MPHGDFHVVKNRIQLGIGLFLMMLSNRANYPVEQREEIELFRTARRARLETRCRMGGRGFVPIPCRPPRRKLSGKPRYRGVSLLRVRGQRGGYSGLHYATGRAELPRHPGKAGPRVGGMTWPEYPNDSRGNPCFTPDPIAPPMARRLAWWAAIRARTARM